MIFNFIDTKQTQWHENVQFMFGKFQLESCGMVRVEVWCRTRKIVFYPRQEVLDNHFIFGQSLKIPTNSELAMMTMFLDVTFFISNYVLDNEIMHLELYFTF